MLYGVVMKLTTRMIDAMNSCDCGCFKKKNINKRFYGENRRFYYVG